RLQRETDRHWRRARADRGNGGEMEAREAHAADALVAMTVGPTEAGGPPGRRADVVVVVDLRAWRRGGAEPGEVCHIVGGGGVPVAVARELAADPFFKAVVHDGRDILTVAHFGRRMSAELRTALELGRPPDLGGVTCVEQGCGRRHGLEWDHVDPVAHGGLTTYDNLRPRCWPHHREKTERDRAAGLLGPSPPPPRGRDESRPAATSDR
ncbi:MAG TPA: HNH endonuclease signature motif containing protein, partial [Acidimicrobiales bacterium]|nr:HNH endonuclease signature motif containing protein [Acidimicrobiales bacterium]